MAERLTSILGQMAAEGKTGYTQGVQGLAGGSATEQMKNFQKPSGGSSAGGFMKGLNSFS
jgi:hypothetical protein